MKVVIFGATGMVGYGVLLECLDDPDIERVITVGRRPVEVEHANASKLNQVEHADFSDLSAIADALSGLDACFWCLGIASAGMSEDDYRRVTVEFTLAAAKVLRERNPDLTFCFVSGAGTNRDGRQMWARVKAEAEDQLAELGFAATYNFRPAMIQPMRGAVSGVRSYRIMYAILSPMYPLLKHWRGVVTSTREVGQAMITAARSGAPKTTLENADINALAAS